MLPLDAGAGACTGGGGGGAGPGGGGGALPPPTNPTDATVAGGFYVKEKNFYKLRSELYSLLIQ